MRDFKTVARRDARAAEKNLVVRVGVVEANAVNEEERLVGIRPAHKERVERAIRARGEERRAGVGAERVAQRGLLAPREFGRGDLVNDGADCARSRRCARAGRHEGLELGRRDLGAKAEVDADARKQRCGSKPREGGEFDFMHRCLSS